MTAELRTACETSQTLGHSSPQSPFRLVIPREKQQRLALRVAATAARRACPVAGCAESGLGVVLVERETTALLCPRHELVGEDGQSIEGQPMFVTAGW